MHPLRICGYPFDDRSCWDRLGALGLDEVEI
jgi:hypothetical protein